ncbi:MAG: hypothetical protein CYPHOPRED_001050 [Cyphobasidiales sp. Tagirdzhanova-0007]|nr:MAG: hypothetical protein CYPHOPRED_001050 [Cyphobasidiales sp. Tagirdzhanova-0007]
MAQADAETLAEIARLSGAINRHKLGLPPLQQPSENSHNRTGRGRGRGRGRGSYYATRGASASIGPARNATGSLHRKLVLNNGSATTTAMSVKPNIASVSAAPSTAEEGIDDLQSSKTSSKGQPLAWTSAISRPTPYLQRTMMNDSNASDLPFNNRSAAVQSGQDIVINGLTFISDASGMKLVRKDSLVANSALTKTRQVDKSSNKAAMHKSTPVKTSVGGQSYVRTKSGNLLSVDLVKRRDLEAKNKRLNKLVETVKGVQKARSKDFLALVAEKKVECVADISRRLMDTEEGEKNAMPTTLVEPVNILDGSRKRSHDNISPSYEDQADSERKKLRVADGVQANDDFVTLVISDTESEEADGEDQDEDEVEGSDSSVESDELDDANIAVSAVNITQQQSAEAGSSPVHSKASDRFNRKASPEEGEESEDEQ